MKEKNILIILTMSIFIIAAFFRLYGVNWDQNHHLHPDERFLTMVAEGLSWPKDLGEYLNTASSPLNPHNRGFGFFVYGTFPVFFTKWVAESLNLGDYNNLTIVGRQLSALFDLGTVILVFLIAKQIVKTRKKQLTINNQQLTILFPLLAMFLYATMVLPIQLSHFYAVDTYLTFFITLSFYFLTRIIGFAHLSLKNKGLVNLRFDNLNLFRISELGFSIYFILLGLAFGLALASKITAMLFASTIGLGLIYSFMKKRNIIQFIILCSLLSVICYLTFRLAQPYLFANSNIFDPTLNQKVLNNWKELKSFDGKNTGFPPGIQWITTKPYIFPLKNMLFGGLGLPLGLIFLLAIASQAIDLGKNIIQAVGKKRTSLILDSQFLILQLALVWILGFFLYQGGQFTKNMRYFIPIYPFIAIICAYSSFLAFESFRKRAGIKIFLSFVICYLLSFLIYPLSFISIYSHPHTRVAASEWIYQNIPPGSVKSDEHWDDALPMSLPQEGYIHEKYTGLEFPLYWFDNEEKWQKMNENLIKTDYIILTSNRLYGSIITVPERYPITFRYYQALFDGSLGFQKVAEFTSRPNIPLPFIKICLTPPFIRYGIVAHKTQDCPLPGISFVDDYADESFTVYDHPKVLIFKKVKSVDYFNLLYR